MPDPVIRKGREGSRWYNERPTADAVADWFYTVSLHSDMQHRDYVSGIVLIPAKEKSDELVSFDKSGLPQLRERTDLVYIPYVKVETRVAYFWRYVEINEGWVASIDPVVSPGTEQLGLPPGYFKYAAADPKGKTVSFVCCSMRVKVVDDTGKLIMHPPPGTKAIATSTRWDVDQNALMKAETGAVGRALGMAGMLVVPGSGVATAEDMDDAAVPAGAAAEPELPAAPPAELSDEQLRVRAIGLTAQLDAADPAKLAEFQAWARGRGLVLAQAQGPVLKGAVKKLEKMLAELEPVTADAA